MSALPDMGTLAAADLPTATASGEPASVFELLARDAAGSSRTTSKPIHSPADATASELIEGLRRKGVLLIAIASAGVLISLALMAIVDGEHARGAAVASALLALIPFWAATKGRTDATVRVLLGLVAALQPALLIYASQNSIWQSEIQLFAVLALGLLVPLCDTRAVLAASTVGVLHHVTVAFIMPQPAFSSSEGMLGTSLHIMGPVLIACFLGWVTAKLVSIIERIANLEGDAKDHAKQLNRLHSDLCDAQKRLEDERSTHSRKCEQLSAAHRRSNERIAADFEQTISAVTHSVASTVSMLERSARGLKAIAQEAGEEANDVANCAEGASRAANVVAAGVAELSVAISEISALVRKQSDLSIEANSRSESGGQAIGSLSEQSRTIGEATRAIVRIAERTDLLSLNAAIEAASAGKSGRGFSIVAQEVKALASQATDAATQIDVFLKGVRAGTLSAESSFEAIDAAIAELGKTATAILHGVGNQTQSADTIEQFARRAAGEADQMVERTRTLAKRASSASELSDELQRAAAGLAQTVRELERSTSSFTASLGVDPIPA
ncbi:hypothetical protein NAP1_06615 [Erythrobacter sp. NAP1]|uniref:methyl-accepting chemotaxis protein n=1 Tax=Erythrobacter sp. NAP1 TaxID=237727 RepID=UPI000068692E|nr:methyl-accepting chemotaxis protein [Erythrobacter sp. NAP1]EAQ30429.1 hypothetical protein NAP1_06615 [Erythrobacter sp. NAP1]